MDIKIQFDNSNLDSRWLAEITNGEELIHDMGGLTSNPNTYPEEKYIEFNNWCQKILGYSARASHHVFEFKKKSELDWFILRLQNNEQ